MLIITEPAVEALRRLVTADDAGVRISLTDPANGSGPGLRVQATDGPDIDDSIINSDGFELYLAGDALEVLDDKVLDAEDHDGAVRFSVRG
jgi:Fe-S cluster assembly iron-binding protein IscA